MRVLAIDTALEACSAVVLDTEQDRAIVESQPMLRGHAEALMPLIGRVIERTALRFSAVDRIAVTVGPGSFTGLRVGISAARGIALAAGKPSFGITTLAAYAAPLIAEDNHSAVAVAIDARHRHVYLQVFAPGGKPLFAPRIASVADAVDAALGAGPVRIIGTGATMLADAWPAGEAAPLVVEDRRAPDVTWVARLAAAAKAPAEPKPLYLRAPDARPQEAARLPRR